MQKSCKKGNQRVVGIERDGYRLSGPTTLAKQGQLVPVAEDKLQMSFEYLKGVRLYKVPGQLILRLTHPHSQKAFPDVLEVPPVLQLLISSGPVTGHH